MGNQQLHKGMAFKITKENISVSHISFFAAGLLRTYKGVQITTASPKLCTNPDSTSDKSLHDDADDVCIVKNLTRLRGKKSKVLERICTNTYIASLFYLNIWKCEFFFH